MATLESAPGARVGKMGGVITSKQLIGAVLQVLGILLVAWIVWVLSEVFLLAFAAALCAIALRGLAGPLEHWTSIRAPWSLLIVCLLTAALAALFLFLLGAQVQQQFSDLANEIPESVTAFGERMGIENLSERVREQMAEFAGRSGFVYRIIGYGSIVMSALSSVILVAVAGVYLAVRPESYQAGALMLVPRHLYNEAERVLKNLGRALRLWLLGQGISMLIVGSLTTVGLYLLDVPSALALGLFAGLASFVPIVGPFVSAIPAVLVALSEEGSVVFWVMGLYVLVQLVESNLIMPLVQRKVVDVPPFLTLFGILGFGVLFGPLGVILGTPLTVVLLVLVKQLYVQDTLGKKTTIPGDT